MIAGRECWLRTRLKALQIHLCFQRNEELAELPSGLEEKR